MPMGGEDTRKHILIIIIIIIIIIIMSGLTSCVLPPGKVMTGLLVAGQTSSHSACWGKLLVLPPQPE